MAKEYTVTAPDGHVVTLEGPEGASDADVIQQAQRLYTPKPSLAVAMKPPVPSDDRTATQVMQDQAAAVLKQLNPMPMLRSIHEAYTSPDVGPALNLIKGAVTAPFKAVGAGLGSAATSARGLGALIAPGSVTAPTSEENAQAAQSAGQFAANVPAIAAGGSLAGDLAKAGVGKLASDIDPTALKAKANSLRESMAANQVSGKMLNVTQPGTVLSTVNRLVAQPAHAAILDTLAKTIDAQHPAVRGNLLEGPEAYSPAPQPPPVQGPSFPPPVAPSEAGQVGATRPEVPSFLQRQLEETRNVESPESQAVRMAQIRDEQATASRGPLTEAPAVGATQPGVRPGLREELAGRQGPIPKLANEFDSATLNKWMDIGTRDVEHGADPGSQVIYEKLLGPDKATTKLNIDNALKDSKARLDALFAEADKNHVIDAQTPLYDAYADAQKFIGKGSEDAFHTKTQGIVDDIESRGTDITQGQRTLQKLLPSEARQLKTDLGDSITWRKGLDSYNTPENQMKIQVYRKINSQLGDIRDISPELKRFGNLKLSSDALADSMNDNTVGKGTPFEAPALTGKKPSLRGDLK
jgi:hypothetical protein